MKLVQWVRFTWDLAKLPDACALDSQYRIRPATREDDDAVRQMVVRALTLDTDWANTLQPMCAMIGSHLDEVFRKRETPCLVVTHGSRIIGASALTLDAEAENNLLTGPCILIEYRSRGIGSALLYHSLAMLRDAGLTRARGVTKEGVPAAKFIYTKFNSVGEEYDFDPELVSQR